MAGARIPVARLRAWAKGEDGVWVGEAQALVDVLDACLDVCGPTGPGGRWQAYHDPHGDLLEERLIPALSRFDFEASS